MTESLKSIISELKNSMGHLFFKEIINIQTKDDLQQKADKYHLNIKPELLQEAYLFLKQEPQKELSENELANISGGVFIRPIPRYCVVAETCTRTSCTGCPNQPPDDDGK